GKLAETEDVRPREIATVGVVGGGLMGAGIAEILLAAGYRVTVVERDADALAAGYARVSAALDRAVERGRLTAEARAAQWARLSGAMDPGALFAADLVIEAVVEDEAVKCELFARLGRILRPGAIMATNTSYLDVGRIAAASGRPADVLA